MHNVLVYVVITGVHSIKRSQTFHDGILAGIPLLIIILAVTGYVTAAPLIFCVTAGCAISLLLMFLALFVLYPE